MVRAADWTRFAQDDKLFISMLKNDILEGPTKDQRRRRDEKLARPEGERMRRRKGWVSMGERDKPRRRRQRTDANWEYKTN
jgi:hypothetical protein